MKRKIPVIILALLLSTVFYSCTKTEINSVVSEKEKRANVEKADKTADLQTAAIKGKIILATTTSTQDSGLLDVLLPQFTAKSGWEVETIAVGTGEALLMGENGEADVLLVHAKAKEEEFVKAGYGLKRYDVMYNDFVVVGPAGDIDQNADVQNTFQIIFDRQYSFVSRGDESGTHTKERGIWEKTGIAPSDNVNYISAGQGMGATILMADEMNAYTLSDRATWLTMKDKTTMEIVCEKDPLLLNYYGVIAVNPDLNERINAEGARDFIDWIESDEAQEIIGNFGLEEYHESLFIPNATANE